ncbi:MAG: PorT family protein [Muribaculaceae bacterium]|nr:PorT family protein [Muribaculaceae bacterium]MDE5929078.1 PorT family protein [Muribaculaceae bacterium]
MKSIKRFLVALSALVAVGATASAQFAWGPRVGVEVNKLHFNSNIGNDIKDSDNRAGITAGLQIEFTVPIVNLGFDASVMYVHRSKVDAPVLDQSNPSIPTVAGSETKKIGGDYIEVPVNFKYKLGLPVVGNVISPYIFTGPSFAFLTSKQAINDAIQNKKVDIAWNFGLGIQLIKHLQIGASYGLGLTKTVEKVSGWTGTEPIDGKNNYWTVTAAWLF